MYPERLDAPTATVPLYARLKPARTAPRPVAAAAARTRHNWFLYLFLLPSAQESFGLAALEAMACEVPVVASAVGGLPEVIEHGTSGFLHAPEDLDGMAVSGVALLTEPPLRQRVTAAALERVRARFCTEHVVPKYEAYYQHVIGTGSRKHLP